MSTKLEDLKPKGSCPKCGKGTFNKPYYDYEFDAWEIEEWLEWSCDYCGYVIKTKTVDAK